jgi:hypothetical protein
MGGEPYRLGASREGDSIRKGSLVDAARMKTREISHTLSKDLDNSRTRVYVHLQQMIEVTNLGAANMAKTSFTSVGS